ncbi:MAG: terminase [Rhizobiaceae bacterium MnEN-MB40S]|nr:MAG: terminase [Rhizobiaceae bacterium MnEN-MB40S]
MKGRKPTLSPDRNPLTKAPATPSWMSADARAEWKRIMPRLIGDRIITRADLAGVENYCVATGRVREIERIFRDKGFQKQLFAPLDKSMQTARQLAAEYGLTPVSRSRVATGDDNDDDDNPLAV